MHPSEAPSLSSTAVLMGWSPETIDAARARGWPFVVVGPPAFEEIRDEHYDEPEAVPFVPFDHRQPFNELAVEDLLQRLEPHAPGFVVPLYEETVLWAGALGAKLRKDPRIFRRARMVLNKAVMKHRAQMRAIRIGACEEALDHADVLNFLARVKQAVLDPEKADEEPVHLKPIEGAGSAGHHVVRTQAEVGLLPISVFPAVVESHLRGQEFSCEAFVHHGEVLFLNLTEYIHLGYSNIVPAGPELEGRRDLVRAEVERLVDAFEIENGVIHPEFFLDMEGELAFGEVAARIPGGHIFDLIRSAYGFDPFAAHLLCCDPDASADEVAAIFPEEDAHDGYHGVFLVYPARPQLGDLEIPEEIEEDPCVVRHTLFDPVLTYLPPRDGHGNHLGTLFLRSEDPEELRERVLRWEEIDFFPLPASGPAPGPVRA